MHDSVRIAKNHRSKADVYALYDHTEGGVYFVDLVSTYHSIRMRHKRCLVNTLAFALDTVIRKLKLSFWN